MRRLKIIRTTGVLLITALGIVLLPESSSGGSRECVVEITSAGIEENGDEGLLRLEWRLKEVLNWSDIEGGGLEQPLFKEVREADRLLFLVDFNGGRIGNTASYNFQKSLGNFSIERGDILSASVSLQDNPGFVDISEEFSRRFNMEPSLGTAEITARADTVYPGARKAVRKNLAGLGRTVKEGGVIAWLLVIILLWGLSSIYIHMRSLFSGEFENMPATVEKVQKAGSLDEIEDAVKDCPVLSRMEIRCGIDEYRRRIGAGNYNSARYSRELERLRNRVYSDLNRRLKKMLETRGRMLSWVISVEMIRCIGVLAPMVGLLGTVIGISDSFGSLYLKIKMMISGQSRAVLENLSGGIHLALNTTVFGLIVGIVFLLCYYLIQFRRSRISVMVDSAVEDVLTKIVEGEYLNELHASPPDIPDERQKCDTPARAAAAGGV